MEWVDEGVIIGTRRHGEAGVIVDVFTRGRGRHLGIVRGGQSSRMRACLQIGNAVRATWRARLEDHLGAYQIEPVRFRAADLIQERGRLFAALAAAGHARLLPERDPHPDLFDAFEHVLETASLLDAAARLAWFEVQVLAELGFGLDLESCAATGASDNLVYVSPKSGRAVSAEAGAPYRAKLLTLPPFLADIHTTDADETDIAAAFRLTGHFLDRHLYTPRGIVPPVERAGLIQMITLGATAAEVRTAAAS
ncbi:MAG: DNA repair protein RecO [Pseudomonadota bacterium]